LVLASDVVSSTAIESDLDSPRDVDVQQLVDALLHLKDLQVQRLGALVVLVVFRPTAIISADTDGSADTFTGRAKVSVWVVLTVYFRYKCDLDENGII